MKNAVVTPFLFIAAWLLVESRGIYAATTANEDGLNPEYQTVGAAKIDITPDETIRLSGYGSRGEPSEGVRGKLWAKALAIGEGDEPAILVTIDLIGAPAWLTAGLVERLNLPESQVAICATHTHSGPHLKDVLNPIFMADIPKDHQTAIERYSEKLLDKVATVCRMAMNNRATGRLAWGQGEVGFAANRRVLENGKWVGFGVQPDGPVDHSLPVMKITDLQGDLLAVLANYACHCTTLGGNFNHIHGDWAGEAQRLLEERHPGATAMIAIGCGADVNPNPRGDFEHVLNHGKALANEVDRVMQTSLKPLESAPETRMDHIDLPLDPLPSRETWEEHAGSENQTAYYAKEVLARLDRGESLPTAIDYPVQTWTFGDDLAMVFLAGEVVVDYAIKLRQRFDASRLWINAYANAAPCYIASRRLYDEGGYEVDRSMWYYDKPTRLSPDNEDLVLDEVLKQMPHRFYSELTLGRLPPPFAREEALATIVAHPDVQVELVAAEPLVMDPIDIAWGADGRMWVVEMADYPLGLDGKGRPGGRVRFLEDLNEDGIYDRSTVFMDSIPYPTSVMPWRDAVLITTAPDILLAKDTNTDGRADEVTSLYTGFNLGNQQHLVNGMQWGLDGWIYLANGDSGGMVRSTASPIDDARDIDGLDLRILPEKGLIEPILGRSQFGRNRDSWGNWFGNNNSTPGWHYALDDGYLRRNPHVTYPESKIQLTESAPPTYPVSTTLSRYNDYEKANRFTGISGFMIYEDDALGTNFAGHAFFAECVHNLVSRAVIVSEGATFSSRRAPDEANSEFLASTDNWFRPTAIRTGPDSALYIADMYRLVIEHPEWIPIDWQRKLDLREGHDKGRIYRVSKKGAKPGKAPRLDRMKAVELVSALDTKNRWQRDQVHQLLVWKPDQAVTEPLRDVAVNGQFPEARGQALWILSQLNGLDEATVLEGLRDPMGGVRRQAVRLSEPLLGESQAVLTQLLAMASDEDLKVRLQVAQSLGESQSAAVGQTLAEMALQHAEDPLLLAGILSSVTPHQETLARRAGPTLLYPQFRSLLRGLSQTLIGSGNLDALSLLLASLLEKREPPGDENQLTAFAEFMQVLTESGSSIGVLKSAAHSSLDDALDKTRALFAAARALAGDDLASIESRKIALRLLSFDSDDNETSQAVVTKLLHPAVPAELQLAAVDCLASLPGVESSAILLDGWKQHGPSLRRRILETLLGDRESTLFLLRRAEIEITIAKAFSAAQVAAVSRHSDSEIKELANQIFGQQVSANRREIIANFEPALVLTGNPQAGKNQFAVRCATCHKIGELGVDVGPDLTALTDKSPRSMLIATLDPNRAVEDKYTQYVATTLDGKSAVGIMIEGTTNSITLMAPGGLKESLLRRNLESLKSSGTSLMPDGLEAGLDHQKMADLIAFMAASDESMEIRADAGGSIGLTADRGTAQGSSVFYNPETESFDWVANGDILEWTVYDLKAGYYDIFTDAALVVEYEGRPFTLTMNDTFVTGVITTTHGIGRFRKRKFGNIEIASDIPKAVFKLQHQLDGPHLSLRELRLIPVP